ncbi:hypothetical protein [Neisseria meningitidis]|uniref:hypothetical protein n=1 Tax=Neisseria meningitidis TaxID=487 RepID=UPI00164A07F1|nr:hypothetical protein [Neisseria meningitidis]
MKKRNTYALLLGIGSLLGLFHPAKTAFRPNSAYDLTNIGGALQPALEKARK